MSNRLQELSNIGQSIWYDNIRRDMLTDGEFQKLIETGILGVTSNPTIFDKAVSGSDDYDAQLKELVDQGEDLDTIYEKIVLQDIAAAADQLLSVFEASNGLDGYVSIEVRPTLADDTEQTIAEARRLFGTLARPNIMIKVPATPAGIPAIETLIADGININITLIFSITHYEAVTDAYLSGLERRLAAGEDISQVASVASFFVSRVDTMVDKALAAAGITSLQGQIAVANAKVAYARFKDIFSGERWEKLAAAGARVQRPLWASTGTKNPAYSDTLYVDTLIGPDTVNTVPPATLEAILDHGQTSPSIEEDLLGAMHQLEELNDLGIDLEAVTEQLQVDGVIAFARSFEALMLSIAEKRGKLLEGGELLTASLGRYQESVDKALADIQSKKIVERIWTHDHRVWKPEPSEITNRLGWLRIAKKMEASIPELDDLVSTLRDEGYTQALLLGMGGSSLAPEVFRKTFGVRDGYLDLAVLDSTDPGAIAAQEENLDLKKTLFIVATKSGGTVETLSLFKYFYNQVVDALGIPEAGAHFIAITDANSRLDEIASRCNFRATFRNDVNIGGRYSALSYFGLVPAALVGVDLSALLDRTQEMARKNGSDNSASTSVGSAALLGAILGEMAKAGRDKLTLITSPRIASFGDWVEQLIAESTGKEGKGILPVVGEPPGAAENYRPDRLFLPLTIDDDPTIETKVAALEHAGHPVVRIQIKDLYDLGGQFFLWELATAIAGYRLGINPFDQPNVEAAKVLAREMVIRYQETGSLPQSKADLQADGIGVFKDAKLSSANFGSPVEALQAFLAEAQNGAYISVQAYVQPTAETDRTLQEFRTQLRDSTRLATTVGYGPRFLHSTGQLHKGDAGKGYFIQLTSDSPQDIPIPDEPGDKRASISFGVLKAAQALGDRRALLDANRRVLRFHLGTDVIAGIGKLITD